MGKVSTTNYKESLETGKIFLTKTFFKRINQFNPEPPIRRCEYCRRVLLEDNKYKHCDNICSGADAVFKTDVRKQKLKKIIVKKEKVVKIEVKKKKEKDLIGHLCKKCGVYKTWDSFSKVHGKYRPRCKDCCNKEYIEYYFKNKQKLSLRHKKYYEEKKKIQNKSTEII